MKVRELIQLLNQHDQNANVVIPGYESGYNDVKEVEKLRLRESHSPEWYNGKYEKDAKGRKKAVVIE